MNSPVEGHGVDGVLVAVDDVDGLAPKKEYFYWIIPGCDPIGSRVGIFKCLILNAILDQPLCDPLILGRILDRAFENTNPDRKSSV